MKTIDLGHIKTTHRVRMGVDQEIRLFNKTQRRNIIKQVQIGVDQYDMTIENVLEMYGISPAVYYGWLRKPKVKKSEGTKTWTIKIKGDNEESVIKYIKAMLSTFELAVHYDRPLDHIFLSDSGSSLTCTKTEG